MMNGSRSARIVGQALGALTAIAIVVLVMVFLSCQGSHTVTLGVEVCGVKAEISWCYTPEPHPPKEEPGGIPE